MNPVCTKINIEKRRVIIAGVTLAVLAAAYMYCVSATVMHVVVRKETNQSITEMQTKISQLEAEYIAAQHAVSEQVAALPGFVETPEKIFIERADTTLVVRDRLLP